MVFKSSDLKCEYELPDDIRSDKLKPMENFTINSASYIDPLLCVTPEKSIRPCSYEPLKGDSAEALARTKVHFDHSVGVRHMSPPEPPDHIKMAQKSPEQIDIIEIDCTRLQPETPASNLDIINHKEERLSTNSERVSNNFEERDDDSNSSTTEVDINTGVVSAMNNVLSVPELNSSKKIEKQIEDLEKQEIDIDSVVKSKFQSSEFSCNRLSEKASCKVNCESTMFPDLVSVNISPGIVNQVETAITNKVKTQNKLNRKKPEVVSEDIPNLMEFSSYILQPESYSLQMPSVQIEQHYLTADTIDSFDIYRHMRVWHDW